MKRLLYILLTFCCIHPIFAQNSTTDFGLKFTGFVNSQLFFDTRQMVEAREGMVSLFPKFPNYDLNGNDINSKSSFNQLAMTSRIRANITGPDVWGANVKAIIEGDFTGSSNIDNNGFRLREAYIQLNWKKTSLLVGSYWHPLYVFEARPVTVGLNTGAPFHAFSRHNQIRLEYKIAISKFILFAGMQRDYASGGSEGKTSQYQRNTGIPNLHLQYQLTPGKHLFGFGIDYKQLMPLLSFTNDADLTYQTNSRLHSYAFTAFAKLDLKAITLKSQFILGQNLSEHIMLGGYLIKKYGKQTLVRYENISQLSYWVDLLSTGEILKFGCFAGYAKNKGGNLTNQEFYGMGANIDYLYRIAPRIQFHSNKFMWATEFEYTVASYFNSATASKGEEVGNLRILTGLFFFF